MLIKQFLNKKEHLSLLNWVKTLDIQQKANGVNAKVFCLKDYIEKFSSIIKRANCFYDKSYKILHEECYILQIEPNGWINVHNDIEKHKDVKNFNILLNKSEQDGYILHDDSKVLWQPKDAYIVNASLLHAVSSIKSNETYYSIILYYYKE